MSTFPLLDQEPPALTTRQRLSRLARLLLALVVLAGIGVGGWAVYGAVTDGGSNSGGATSKVLVVNSIRQLALADPDGAHQQPFAKFGLLAGSGGVHASPDGHTLLTDTGQLVTLRDGKPVTLSTALYAALDGPAYSTTCTVGGGVCYFNTGQILTLEPFANHGADIVYSLGADEATGPNVVEIVGLDGKHPQKLGVAVDYAGDPQEAAAFVTVPGKAAPGQEPVSTAVEHRSVTGETTTVVTAPQIAKALGVIGDQSSLGMDVAPDPTGKTLAVVAHGAGVLVYTRTGQLIDKRRDTPDGPLFWSNSGTRLIYDVGGAVLVWTPGHGAQRIALPKTAQGLVGSCVWAPDNTRAACVGYAGQDEHYNAWVLVDVTHHTAHAYPAAGLPILWEK